MKTFEFVCMLDVITVLEPRLNFPILYNSNLKWDNEGSL